MLVLTVPAWPSLRLRWRRNAYDSAEWHGVRCRVLQRCPSDLAALSNRGYAFRKLGKFAAASQDYTAALKQSPGTVRLYNNRGYCLAKLGKYKSAIQDYQHVIQLDPANAHAYHNR